MKYFFIIFIFFFTFSGASQTRNVIFIGGKEQVCSLSRQVELFKIGYGTPTKFISFKYTHNTEEILRTISNNQDALVVMFSAGCIKAKEILLSNRVNFKNVYLIEPYSPNESLSFVIDYTKFPGKNVYVGIVKERGKGITRNTQSSNSKNHCESLTSVGTILKSK